MNTNPPDHDTSISTPDLSDGASAVKEAGQQVESRFCDPLLMCLLRLTKLKNTPCSETSLLAGLPLVNEKLTPELFVRAASRAGLQAKITQRPLQDIPELVLPVVLLLDNNQAIILLSSDTATGSATVMTSARDEEVTMTLDELHRVYTGHAIYTRVAHQFNEDIASMATSSDDKRHWFWSVMRSSWRIYRDVLLASLFINLFAVANPLFVMNVYDRVVPNNALETLWVLALGVMIVYLFDAILKALRGYFIEVAGKKCDIILSSYLFERVLGSKFTERPASVGSFVSQFREFDTVRNFYTTASITAFIDLPFVLLFLLLIFYVGGALVWVPVIALPIILIYGLVMRKPIQRAVEQTFMSSAQKNATLVESLVGLETVKVLGAEGSLQSLWEQSVGHLSRWSQKMRLLSLSVSVFSSAIQQVSSVIIVIGGVYLIADRELTMGALIACVMLSGRALGPISQVANLLVSYDQTKTALDALDTIVAKEQERDPKKPFVKRPSFNGAIQFKNVTFAYPNEEYNVLDNVSFAIQPGEKVALIGRIGSGKSTIHKLLLGLYKPQSGSILVDGIDIQQIDPADLRRHLGYMPQDVVLFSGSVKTNIMYGSPHVEDVDIIRAAEVSGVKHFIDSHPLGFDRAVGERGQALSGGQRQSVGMARAMLNKVPIYLFDEPTSGMDNTTESHVKNQLVEVLSEKTLILVTHKTSLLSMIHRVIVLDQGRVIADGPKEPVLEALKKGQLRVS